MRCTPKRCSGVKERDLATLGVSEPEKLSRLRTLGEFSPSDDPYITDGVAGAVVVGVRADFGSRALGNGRWPVPVGIPALVAILDPVRALVRVFCVTGASLDLGMVNESPAEVPFGALFLCSEGSTAVHERPSEWSSVSKYTDDVE